MNTGDYAYQLSRGVLEFLPIPYNPVNAARLAMAFSVLTERIIRRA